MHAIPGFKDKPPSAMKPYLKQWHQLALPHIINATEFDEEFWDFEESWDKVRYPKGEGWMAQVLERAKQADLPAAAMQYESDKIRLLVAVCRELQREAGDKPFFLSSYWVGQRFGIGSMRAWRWLRRLCDDGVLELIRKGNRQEANEYRYGGTDTDRWPFRHLPDRSERPRRTRVNAP